MKTLTQRVKENTEKVMKHLDKANFHLAQFRARKKKEKFFLISKATERTQ